MICYLTYWRKYFDYSDPAWSFKGLEYFEDSLFLIESRRFLLAMIVHPFKSLSIIPQHLLNILVSVHHHSSHRDCCHILARIWCSRGLLWLHWLSWYCCWYCLIKYRRQNSSSVLSGWFQNGFWWTPGASKTIANHWILLAWCWSTQIFQLTSFHPCHTWWLWLHSWHLIAGPQMSNAKEMVFVLRLVLLFSWWPSCWSSDTFGDLADHWLSVGWRYQDYSCRYWYLQLSYNSSYLRLTAVKWCWMLHVAQDSLRWLVPCTAIINSGCSCSLLLDSHRLELVDFDSIFAFELSRLTVGWHSYHISHNGSIWQPLSPGHRALRSSSSLRQHLVLAA